MPAAPYPSVRGLADTRTASSAPRRSPSVPQSMLQCHWLLSAWAHWPNFVWVSCPRTHALMAFPLPSAGIHMLPTYPAVAAVPLSPAGNVQQQSLLPSCICPAATFAGRAGRPLSWFILSLLKWQSILSPLRSQNFPCIVSQNGYRT